jgi:hypothetical protein
LKVLHKIITNCRVLKSLGLICNPLNGKKLLLKIPCDWGGQGGGGEGHWPWCFYYLRGRTELGIPAILKKNASAPTPDIYGSHFKLNK